MTQAEWSDGYVKDASYAETFFRELSPAWINYVAALNGVAPRSTDSSFTYLELGCGFGGSAVVNAGAFPHGAFHACDFNPIHTTGGERHAAALGLTNIRFHEAPFHEVLSLELPEFDFIVLHGVYSWVGPEARRSIRRVLAEKLKPGGLVYASYNCLPGWSVEAPLRKLLVELAATAEGGSTPRAEQALRMLRGLSDSKLRYFNANPAAGAAIESYAKRPAEYLVHEFLNETWEPFYSVDVGDDMAEAGLTYVGSATLVDNHPALVIDSTAARAVTMLPAGRQQQLATDFAVNRRFRRDVFVRGGAPPARKDTASNVYAAPVGMLGSPDLIETKVRVPRGEIRFQDHFVQDLQSLMRQGSMTLGDIVAALRRPDRNEQEIARNVMFLVAAGTLTPFARAQSWPHDGTYAASGVGVTGVDGVFSRTATPLLNRVLALVAEQGVARAVPSEVLGNGVPIVPDAALALAEWLHNVGTADTPAVLETLLPTLLRLGLIR